MLTAEKIKAVQTRARVKHADTSARGTAGLNSTARSVLISGHFPLETLPQHDPRRLHEKVKGAREWAGRVGTRGRADL